MVEQSFLSPQMKRSAIISISNKLVCTSCLISYRITYDLGNHKIKKILGKYPNLIELLPCV